MDQLPGARVVRGGRDEGGRERDASVAPRGRVLRLAPRALPPRLILHLLLGGPRAMLGWAFATLGMVLVLAVALKIDPRAVRFDREADATITSIEATGSSEDGQRYRVRYRFLDESGLERDGESYASHSAIGPTWRVDYRSDDPSDSQLWGVSGLPYSPVLLVFFAVPIIGFVLVLRDLPGAVRGLRLLRRGVETSGRLIRERETGSWIRKARVVALTFEYEVDGKPYTATVRTHTPGPLEDDEREAMLYDPRSPSRATPLDHLPGAPRITADGELEARSGAAYALLIAPVLFAALVTATAIRML